MLFVYIILFAYFLIQYFFTQTIYSKNKFGLVLIFSLAAFCFTFFGDTDFFNKNRPLAISVGAIPLFYTLILFLIKKKYSSLNSFFVSKKWISQENISKDFTYFLWSQNFYWPRSKAVTFHWWNEKLAQKPTILDRLLTGFVLFLPLILSISMFLLILK